MSMHIGHNPGASRLNFNLGGGRMEYVFGGALGLIILLAVVFTIWGGGDEGKASGRSSPPECRCWCVPEGKEVVLKGISLNQMRMFTMPGNYRMMPPCPSCQKKNVLVPEMFCQKCKTWFATDEMKRGQMTPPQKLICPTCKTNIFEYKPS